MEVRDSRRLTGPNILTDGPAAVLDIAFDAGDEQNAERAVAAWSKQAQRMLGVVGWADARRVHRIFPGGMSLAFHAPIDALYAATEVNEWAWDATLTSMADPKDGGSAEASPAFDDAAERLRQTIAEESNPAALALESAAVERGTGFLWDDDFVSVGLGNGSQTWAVDKIPAPEEIDWTRIHDIPVAQVTGTNGKTTTVRLLAAMVKAANLVPGISSTDWISAGGDILDHGDYSGPGGARQVLRDPRVQCAVLETARGGMLRRGLAIDRTDVALITNVAADHLGEFGVHDLDAIAECKFVVARAARHLVLNADDPIVRKVGLRQAQPKTWFSLQPDDPDVRPLLTEHLQNGGSACLLERGRLVLKQDGKSLALVEVAEVPLALGGAAKHNVANALGAIAVATQLGLGNRAIAEGLRQFESTPETNPGRLNEFDVGGVRLIVDFAHNPHGVQALLDMASALPASRRLISIGQAGDRDDESILELARATWRARPDKIVIKEMEAYLRGRAEGEISRMLERELLRLGATEVQLLHADSELETAEAALAWAEPGDLVLLIVHSDRDRVVEFLKQRSAES